MGVLNSADTSMLVGLLSVFALLYFCGSYKRLEGQEIGFPIYIYFAMFPHKLRAFSLFAADDAILKVVLIADLLLLLVQRKKVKYNVHEFLIFIAVLIADMAAYIGSRFYDQSLLITGLVNILFMFVFSFGFRNRVESTKGMYTAFEIIKHNAVILSIGAVLELLVYNVDRAELGLNNPNYLGYYLAVAFCVYLYSTPRFHFGTFCYGAIVVIGVVCTGSYSILFCFPMYVLFKLVYGVSNDVLKPVFSWAISIGLVLVAVVIVWMSTSREMLSIPLIRNILDDKDTGRIYIWQDALQDWENSLFFGVGYNCWRSNYGIGYVTHNDILRILVETGIIGMCAFIWYWFSLIKRIANSKSKNQPFYMSLMLTIVVFSCFHNNLNSIMFWVILSFPVYDNIICFKGKNGHTGREVL